MLKIFVNMITFLLEEPVLHKRKYGSFLQRKLILSSKRIQYLTLSTEFIFRRVQKSCVCLLHFAGLLVSLIYGVKKSPIWSCCKNLNLSSLWQQLFSKGCSLSIGIGSRYVLIIHVSRRRVASGYGGGRGCYTFAHLRTTSNLHLSQLTFYNQSHTQLPRCHLPVQSQQ